MSRPKSERIAVAALALILVGAAALRLIGIRYGLPYPLLNPDEGSIVPRAWKMAHLGRLDPGWYDYPTLLMYVLAPVEAFFDDVSYVAARVVAVAIGVGGVAAAWWLGRAAYGTWAALTGAAATAVATTHVAYSRVAVTDVLLTLGVSAAMALALSGRIEWAGAAVGLAASAKYPGVLAFAPLLVAGWGQWRRLGVAAAIGLTAFFVTSPFVILRAGEAWDDVSRVQRLARGRWLGFEDDPATPLAFADRLWETLGPALVVAAAGLGIAAWRRTRADLVLASFAAVWALHLMPIEAHFDRYVLPLVPVLGVLAGRVPVLVPAAAVALVVPLAWSIADTAELTKTDTRVVAAAWIERHVPAEARLVADPSTPPLPQVEFYRLLLPHPARQADPNRDVDRLRRQGVDYVLVSGAVTDRVLAAAEHYPREAAFYAELEAATRRVLVVRPGGEVAGPWVALYKL